jgi:hypothetical protein
MYRQNRVFTAAAVAALALGIGANTAIFSVVSAVLLKPLPFPDGDNVVFFMSTNREGQGGPASSPAKFAHWRQQTTVIQDATAYRTNVVNYTGGAVPEQLQAGQVSADYFKLFGAQLFKGRTFSAQEDLPGGPKVAVLSHGLWARRFGSDPDIIGKTVLLSGDPHEVIGIISPTFDLAEVGQPPELWVPFQLDPNTVDQGHFFQSAARLKRGVSLEQGQARLKLSATEYTAGERASATEELQSRAHADGVVRGARPAAHSQRRRRLRAAHRVRQRREPAARVGHGASAKLPCEPPRAGRGRIVRQLLTESVSLSVMVASSASAWRARHPRAVVDQHSRCLASVRTAYRRADCACCRSRRPSIGTGSAWDRCPRKVANRLTTALKDSTGRSGATLRHNKARLISSLLGRSRSCCSSDRRC